MKKYQIYKKLFAMKHSFENSFKLKICWRSNNVFLTPLKANRSPLKKNRQPKNSRSLNLFPMHH